MNTVATEGETILALGALINSSLTDSGCSTVRSLTGVTSKSTNEALSGMTAEVPSGV
jgi:uncharacterized protein YceK